MPLDLSTGHFALLALAAFLIGGAKTGLSGIGLLAVPIFALVFDPFRSAGLLLPVLIVADVIAVIAWRRHGDQKMLWPLIPWVLLGTVLCTLVLKFAQPPDSPLHLIDQQLKRLLGLLILAMLALSLYKDKLERWICQHPRAAPLTGFVAGIATTLNAAGPVMNLYLLARKLPKEAFVGTGAWFFLVLNAAKLPLIGAATGTLQASTFLLTLWLSPFILLGCWLGLIVVRRIPERAFQIAVRILILAAGLRLILS